MTKPEDETKKKRDQDAAKKAKENADKKKADAGAAERKAQSDAAAKRAEAERQEDLNNHMTQPFFMLTQAGVKVMKDNPNLGKNGKVIYIPGLYYKTVEVLLNEVCRIVRAQCAIENVTYASNTLTGKAGFEWKKGTLKFFHSTTSSSTSCE